MHALLGKPCKTEKNYHENQLSPEICPLASTLMTSRTFSREILIDIMLFLVTKWEKWIKELWHVVRQESMSFMALYWKICRDIPDIAVL